jgi:hypothetical protein
MKPTSKEILDAVSKHSSNQLIMYKFNMNTLKISDKYREGRVTGLKYIGDLTFHFMQEEKRIQLLFHEEVLKQMKFYSCLEETEYKQGLYDALNDTLDQIRDIKDKANE